jgi:hypothetical protein
MDKLEQLKAVLKSRAEDNRITCKIALETATQFDVSPAVVGKTLNQLKIKLTRCQLGCF